MLALELSGTPQSMGLAHGESFRTQIQALCALRRELLMDYFKPNSLPYMEALIKAQAVRLNTVPQYKEELQAIAIGAQVSLEDLIILNNFTDLIDWSWSPSSEEVEGCSTFFLSSDSGWIGGQSWDMHASAQDYLCHLTINNNPKIELLSLVGCLGIAGINEHGVGVFVNNLSCKKVAKGFIWSAVVRLMLQEKNANESLKVLISNRPSSGRNYLIVDNNFAFNVETTGSHSVITQQFPKDKVLFHTNHYLGILKEHEYTINRNMTTHWRYKKLEKFFSNPHHVLNAEQLAQSLLIKESFHSVYVPGDGSFQCFKTCGGLIVDKKNNQLTLFQDAYDTGFRKTVLIS